MTPTCDPIAIIEEGYAQSDPDSWLKSIGALVVPQLSASDRVGVTYYFGPAGVTNPIGIGDDDEGGWATKVLAAGMTQMPPELQQRVFDATQTPGVSSIVDLTGPMHPDVGMLAGRPFEDSLALTVPLDNGRAAVIANFMGTRCKLDGPTRRLWQRIAIHLSAGNRLLGRTRSVDAEDVEAALTPEGTVMHAVGEGCERASQDALRDAVKKIDHARSRRGRGDPDAALALWQGLLLGRWSLVDHFDTDGKRFVLARKNDPTMKAPRRLSPRERQVVFYATAAWSNAEIGYALGLADTTVVAHLTRALKKLGLEDRTALIRLGTRLVMWGQTP